MKKKILIIGGNGYIGSKLHSFLEQKKLDVTSIDNYLYGNTKIKKFKKQKIIFKDIRNLKPNFLEKYDSVICLAALSNNPINIKNQNKSYDIVKKFTLNLACKIENIGNQLIFPSSCSVYGKSYGKILNENSNLNPVTLYSKNKMEIENNLKKKNKKKFNCIILRPATVFGVSDSMRFDIVVNMLLGMGIQYKNIILNSDGSSIRPFIYLEDLCNFFYKSIFLENQFKIINAGFNNFNYSINEIAKIIANITNSKIKKFEAIKKLHQDDLIKNFKDERSYQVDFSLAKKELNIFPKHNFKKLIDITYIEIKKILKQNSFESKNFYRLNKIKYLIKSGYLNPDKLQKNG